MGARIMIVEDDRALCRELVRVLGLSGYDARAYEGDFARAADAVLADSPDLVLLDLTLPGASGHDVVRALRARSEVPVVMITSSDSEFDEVMGMNLGADDYVTKPFSPAVLLARIAAALRRSGSGMHPGLLEHRGVVLDLAAGTVTCDGRTETLSRNEQRILAALMRAPGTVVTRSELMCELWETDDFIDDNTLTVNVNRLRTRLATIGAPDDFLTTRRGQGYML